MQIKTTVSYDITSTRMAIIIKVEITGVGEDVGKLEPFVHCWWEYKIVHSSVDTILAAPQKVKYRITYGLAITLLDT